MIGAILGDIVGSIYEFNNIKSKDFPLFTKRNFFTDDTILTFAVADAIMQGGKPADYIKSFKRFVELYPDDKYGYGDRFYKWATGKDDKPYNSIGNGSAMRVSPVAWAFNTLEKVKENAAICAGITHNHPEGIQGACATAEAIFLARKGNDKETIRKYIETNYDYDLDFTIEEIRNDYRYDVSCFGTIPYAVVAFLDSADFEDAIRNAISIGGDYDTLAAITGSIAEAFYNIPKPIAEKALSYLDDRLLLLYQDWLNYINQNKGSLS
jgi:ADP-ribosylglycohydrolase